MPDSAAIIGKIAVKVIPDTDKFKDELKRQLNTIEKELRSEKYAVKVQATLDGSKIKEDAKKIREEAKAALKDITIQVNMDDQASVAAGIARIQAELAKLDAKSIKIKLNREELNAELDKLTARLEEIHHINLQVDKNDLKDVEKAIAQIDAELKKLNQETIEVKLDKDHLQHARDQFQALLDDAAHRAQAAADKAVQDSIKRSALTVKEVNAALNDIKFAPGVDEAKLEATKREIEAVLFRIAETKAKVDLELDPLAKRKLELEIETLQAKVHDLTVGLKPEVNEVAKTRTQATLDLLAHARNVDFKPNVDNKALTGVMAALDRISGYRDGRVFVDDLKDMLFNLDLAIPQVSKLALGIGGIGAVGLSASANLFALSASLAAMAPAALALPGIFGGLAIGIIASGVVLKDFNTQFSQLRVGLGRKLTAGSWWAQLQNTMSSNFWNIAKQPIQDMVYTLFPLLEKGLNGTSTSLGNWFGGLATGLNNALGPRMAGMFADLNKSIDIATGSTGALAQSVGVLGTVGAAYLPRLAQWFTDIANKTADWLTAGEKTGKLNNLINTGVRNLKNMGKVLLDIFGIWGDINRAATAALGDEILGKMARGLDKVHAATKSANFQKNLVDVFVAARTAVMAFVNLTIPALKIALKNLGDIMKSSFRDVGATLGELASGILTAFNNPRLQSAIKSLFDTLRNLATELRPAWDKVGEAVGAVLSLVNVFISTATPGAATAIENLAGWVSTLADALKPLVKGLGDDLNRALDLVAPGITKIVDSFKAFADGKGGQAVIGFFRDLGPLIGDIGDWLGKAAVQLAKWANTNLPKIRDDLKPLIDDLRNWLKDNGQTMIDIIKGIGDVLVTMAAGLGQVGGALPAVVGTVGLVLLIKRLQGVYDVLKVFQEKFPGGIAGALGLGALMLFITADSNDSGPIGWLGKLRDKLQSVSDFMLVTGDSKKDAAKGKAFLDSIKGAWKWMNDNTATDGWLGGVKEKYLDFGMWLRKVGPEFGNWFVGGWSQAWTDLGTEWSGFSTEFSANWSAFWGGVEQIFNGFIGWFTGGWSQMWKGLKDEWSGFSTEFSADWDACWQGIEGIFTGFIDWFTGGWSQMWAGLKSEWSGWKDDFVADWNSLWGNVKTIWNNVTTWLGNTVFGVVQWFQDLPDKIKRAMGNLRDLLSNAASDIIDGFIGWLEKKKDAVKKWFKGLTDIIPDWKGPRSRDKTLLQDAGTLIMDGFINGLESRYDAVRKSLAGLTSDIAATDMGTINVPDVSGVSGRLASAANGAYAGTATVQSNRTLNYYAAPGSSISSEEDLFTAAGRTRMGGF